MTDALTDLIERLKELDAKRTPGEWEYFSAGEAIGVTAMCADVAHCHEMHDLRPRREVVANARFITTLANESIPALKAAQDRIKVLEELLGEAITLCDICSDWNLDEVQVRDEMEPIYEVKDRFATALKGEG